MGERQPVVVGQIWEDQDPRAAGHRIQIERIEGLYAFCFSLETGRHTRVALDRLHPRGATKGYRLIASSLLEATEKEGSKVTA